MVNNVDFDFDVNARNGYLYLWIRNYMMLVNDTVARLNFNFKNKTLLDIGIGRGRAMPLYKQWGIRKVVGLDIDKNGRSYVYKQAKRLKMNIEMVIDDEKNTRLKKIPANSYDAISLINVLHMLDSSSQPLLLSEIKRILKPQGIVIILNMEKPSLFWLSRLIARRDRDFIPGRQLIALMKPFKLLSTGQSNYFYCINKIYDSFIKILGDRKGRKLLENLDNICKLLGIPGSTQVFIFTKQSGILHSP